MPDRTVLVPMTLSEVLDIAEALLDDDDERVDTAWEVGYQHGVTAGRSTALWTAVADAGPSPMGKKVIAWGRLKDAPASHAALDEVLFYRQSGDAVWRHFDEVTYWIDVDRIGEPR
jgi:hypothetical protein